MHITLPLPHPTPTHNAPHSFSTFEGVVAALGESIHTEVTPFATA